MQMITPRAHFAQLKKLSELFILQHINKWWNRIDILPDKN
jgi:hypothetical protein